MNNRPIFMFLVGAICGSLMLAGGLFVVQAAGGVAEAQGTDTWQTAGGTTGFSLAEWGTGQGDRESLDEWIESMPASCDIETIPAGVSFVHVFYRCDG